MSMEDKELQRLIERDHVSKHSIQGDSEISLEKKCGVFLTQNNFA
jgi:hypothetical protein